MCTAGLTIVPPPRRPGWLPAILLAAAAAAAGCALGPTLTGVSLTIAKPILIPPGQAHAVLQHGRLADAANRLEPYCEFEVRAVSGAEPQVIRDGQFRVGRVSRQVLLDPTTRIPMLFAASSCVEPLFQEEVWWLRSARPSEAMFLRCIAPYYNCAFGPPLAPEQVQREVGGYLAIKVGEPAVVPR